MMFRSKKTSKNKSEYAIEVNDIDKSFWLPDEKVGSFKGYFLQPWKLFKKQGKRFDALSDVSFKIKKGEFVGIIGKNGSGKSTLLKLIAGIYSPDKGNIKINGKLVPFLELGVGFNPDLSARENIFLNGAILGMSHKFLKSKIDEILEFAEVEEFADTPIKNFSSGMTVRLAFAIAIQTNADIYLLDEVLSVGDVSFRAKSLAKIKELINSGATVLYVSHDLGTVEKLTRRTILLSKSRIIADGAPSNVVNTFRDMINQTDKEDSSKEEVISGGDGRAKITDLQVIDSNGKLSNKIRKNEKFSINLELDIEDRIENPVVYVGIRSDINSKMYEINTDRVGEGKIGELKGEEKLEVEFNVNNILNPGIYSVWVHLGDPLIEGKGLNSLAAFAKYTNLINILPVEEKKYPNWSGPIQTSFDYKVKYK